MAWTATIIEKRKEEGTLKIPVEFSDGVRSFVETFSMGGGNLETLKRMIRARIEALGTIDATAGILNPGTIDSTPAPAPIPTDFETWLVNYNKWNKVKRLIDLGVLTGTEPAATNLLNQVKTDFRVAYIDLI